MNCSAIRAMLRRATDAAAAFPNGTCSATSRPRSSTLGTSAPSKYSSRWRRTSSSLVVAGKTSTKRKSCVLNDGCDIAHSSIRSLHHDAWTMRVAFSRAQFGDAPGERGDVGVEGGRHHSRVSGDCSPYVHHGVGLVVGGAIQLLGTITALVAGGRLRAHPPGSLGAAASQPPRASRERASDCVAVGYRPAQVVTGVARWNRPPGSDRPNAERLGTNERHGGAHGRRIAARELPLQGRARVSDGSLETDRASPPRSTSSRAVEPARRRASVLAELATSARSSS